MTLPEADVARHRAGATVAPPAAPASVQVLRHRADFLRAARARRQGTASLLLQARRREPDEGDPESIRVGYTCSRKIGNAVTRNRAKRRLREAARAVLPVHGRPGWDYVLVGRPGATVERDFNELLDDLRRALRSVHASRATRREAPA
jgi:ribonuclease P protein component